MFILARFYQSYMKLSKFNSILFSVWRSLTAGRRKSIYSSRLKGFGRFYNGYYNARYRPLMVTITTIINWRKMDIVLSASEIGLLDGKISENQEVKN